jgi:hypothetical protein
MTEHLELTVAERDCADEARQIETALGRMKGVLEVRATVGARQTIESYDSHPHRARRDPFGSPKANDRRLIERSARNA